MKKMMVSFRVPTALYGRAKKVLKVGHYSLTFTQLVLRGIELAIEELENVKR